jgi:preprotein translocase subunit Sec63
MAPNLRSDDYYEILGCPRNANDAVLKKAYRKLAVKVSREAGSRATGSGRRPSRVNEDHVCEKSLLVVYILFVDDFI